ncbi:Zn-ribbon domain-containing OB-fold protein [Puniceibacterium sp. IMCC21224]|uniref:Zn-ribbon domain-containing OB-fold protein n=1 Tax=Puniceibacterium sp. IMCC21224 TaxID=1618204 RepID=UPI00064E0671|nr:Zn-ribbon domain-containing OB-fold protein [Puniceibacterium sp. IMCC21224]KMK65105.1 putative nucleic-acid-binding protein containing a Zn-ribbon [Puniceibacterium sp. IMCC21224]
MTPSETSRLLRPEPNITNLSAPFWDLANDRTLATPKCSNCGDRHFPPGPNCPTCLSKDLKWVSVSGHGKLVSWVIFHQVYWDDVRDDVPYLVATVDLDEGIRLLSNLVGSAAENPEYGMALQVTFRPNTSGRLLPVFERAD